MTSNYRIITHDIQSTVCTTAVPGAQVRDVSFGSSYRVPRGFVYVCDFYVDTELDSQSQATLQISHVLKHLVLIAQRFKGELVQFRLFHNLSVKPVAVTQIFINTFCVAREDVRQNKIMIVQDENVVRAKL